MTLDFERWFQRQAPAVPQAEPEPELPDGIREVLRLCADGSGTYLARCCSCENDYELDLDRLEDFDPDCNYCGGSPRCLP